MVPKLRFRNFTQDWHENSLGDLVDIKSGNSPSNYELSSVGEYPFIKVEDMNNCSKYQVRAREFVVNSQPCFPTGSVVFPKRGAAIMNNKVRILNQNSCADTNMMALVPINIHQEYLYYLISFVGLYKIADTSTIPQINNKHILPFKVIIPEKKEQTKVANFLSSLDEKITLLSKQHGLLCQYKKGMMHKIFSQELRFKGSTSWKIENLFGLAVNNTLTNGVFNDPMNTGSGYKLINVVNMYKEPQIDEGDLTLLKLDEKTFNKNKVKNGDIFFTRSSLVKEGIAWSNIYLGNSDDITYDGHLIKMTPDETKVFPQFLYYCLKTSQVRSQLIKGGKTATMTTIGQDDVGKTSLHIPSLNEQIKIANFLSAIDDKITTKKVELDKLKTWKQGLLQQMFV